MTKRQARGESLLADMDAAARALLQFVNPSTIGEGEPAAEAQPIDPKGRVAAFQAVTAYLAVKHKIEPAGNGPSGIDRYSRQINGAAQRGARGKAGSAGDGEGDEEPAGADA